MQAFLGRLDIGYEDPFIELLWVGKPHIVRALKWLVLSYGLDIIFLMETKLAGINDH